MNTSSELVSIVNSCSIVKSNDCVTVVRKGMSERSRDGGIFGDPIYFLIHAYSDFVSLDEVEE